MKNKISKYLSLLAFLPIIFAAYDLSGTTANYTDCKQQICVKLPNGSPAVGHSVVVRNSSGAVVASFITDSTGCFGGPGLPNFTVGLVYTAYDETEDNCAASTQFTACEDGAIIITFCHN